MSSRSFVLLRRLPRPTVYSAAELILLLLIAMQAARLFWIVAAPIGPVGDWRAQSSLAAPGDAVLADFDPFFRLQAGSGPAVVTSLSLTLFGTREDRATGRGSAIIALPDGRQMSFMVGEEIMPGVRLTAVGFDNVTIDRQGTAEQIFLDQSPAATVAGGTPPNAPPNAPNQPQIAVPTPPPSATTQPPRATTPPQPAGQAIGFAPRIVAGRVNGIIVSPGGDGGNAFRAAGFAPGDVIVTVNGQRVTSMEQARGLIARSGGNANVMVDRGGRAVPMRVRF
ncbi:MAG TPA: type II secretion system protein N [Allosphingosinicella sp.]|nr:type II secretion system protein N [Allosphingosinicella sp.]